MQLQLLTLTKKKTSLNSKFKIYTSTNLFILLFWRENSKQNYEVTPENTFFFKFKILKLRKTTTNFPSIPDRPFHKFCMMAGVPTPTSDLQRPTSDVDVRCPTFQLPDRPFHNFGALKSVERRS